MSQTAAFVAIGLGAFSVMVCLVSFPVILQEISQISNELETEMDAWKSETDGLWRDMNQFGRVRRQAYGGYGAPPRSSFPSGPQVTYPFLSQS